MTHPIPPGTRDVLPDEMLELRRLQAALAEVFLQRGYGEVATPTIEYYDVLARGDIGDETPLGPGRGASPQGAPIAYRFSDERGDLLAMRSDMTIPIARLVANRFAGAELPLRFFYMANAYRAVRPQRGQLREFMQVGVELIGADAPGGTAEVVEVLVAALDAAGLSRAVIGLGDADLYRQLLTEIGVEGEARSILDRLAAHDLVGLETQIRALDEIGDVEREILLQLASMRGGAEILEQAHELGGEAVERATSRLEDTYAALVRAGVSERVQLDLGLLRDLGYYSGAILEVYDPALGHVLGGGGRYDELMGRFGAPLPAAGFGLYLQRMHIAQAEEERLGGCVLTGLAGARPARSGGPLKLAVPRGALFAGTLDMLDAVGVDTAGPRGDSRALIFETSEMTLVTMRPSDVPTYVEAGSAELGITGKDVLMEQRDRAVYELLDLGFGACRMVLAARRGDTSLGESERRLGTMRIATKYPRIAERYFEDTGRQAEVIEVKGSVELAPLVGLADGIVDLVDTGRTFKENELEVREEIARCSARLVANRIAHKLRAAEVDGFAERLRETSS